MKEVQLIKVTEETLYLKDGEVLTLTPEQKLLHSIFFDGEIKRMRKEEVIERWRVRNNKEADKRFWDYCEENRVDARDYFIVTFRNE